MDYSDNKMRGYGNLIIIEHSDSFFTIYAHNKENLEQEKVVEKQGDIIAGLEKREMPQVRTCILRSARGANL